MSYVTFLCDIPVLQFWFFGELVDMNSLVSHCCRRPFYIAPGGSAVFML